MAELEYIRASSIATYIDCNAKFYFQNIEQVKTPNKPALAFGSAGHKALETNFTQKIITRRDLPIEQVKQVFSDNLDLEFSNVDRVDFTDDSPGVYKDTGIELIEMYQKEHAYRIFPALVEQQINVKFNGLKYGLSGKIDVQDEDGVLIDHKTTSKQVMEISEAYKIQVGGAYHFLLKELTKQPVNGVRIDFLVRKTKKTYKSQVIPLRVPIDERYFFNVFRNVSNGIEHGIFTPNRNNMYCSRKFCQFWDICEKRYGGVVK